MALITRERYNAEEQKKKDLERLRRTSAARPVKKSGNDRAPVRKRDSEKKSETVKKIPVKQSDPLIPESEHFVSSGEPVAEISEEEKKQRRRFARLLNRLRGTKKTKKEIEPEIEYVEAETGRSETEIQEYTRQVDYLEEKAFWAHQAETVLNQQENERGFDLIFMKDANIPNGLLSTALSVAVGIIYYDETGLVDRLITVRRIFGRFGDILIDAFCHDLEAPRMILLSKVVRLYDIKTLMPYLDPVNFLLHDIAGVSLDESFHYDGFIRALSEVRYDLAALAYVAKVDASKSDLENRLIFDYVKQKCIDLPFDEDQMFGYISRLYPDEQSFFEAMDVIVKQPHAFLQLFVETFLKLVLSDGVIHDNERELLAETLYALRLNGVELNILGLK